MTSWDQEAAALHDEWEARRRAAGTRRTSARLTAADAAFRAYRGHLASRVPEQRQPAECPDGAQPAAP